jgi:hypothetical protein
MVLTMKQTEKQIIKKEEDKHIFICRRENKPRKDTKLYGFFLCKTCYKKFTKVLGNPDYKGDERLDGYCSYCNRSDEVSRICWFLCDVCNRVVSSFGREKAASRFILDFWKKEVNKHTKWRGTKLKVLDPASLRKYTQGKKTSFSDPDFINIDNKENPLFFIEMKTGRNSIKDMSQFQLDTSDCDDIMAGAKKYKIPSYLFHLMVREEYKPPTFKHVALGAWWVNTFDMIDAFKNIRMRDKERRNAAFFSRKMFKPIGEFFDHLNNPEFEILTKKSKDEIPVLYKLLK